MKATFTPTETYNRTTALEYIHGCISQCSNVADFNKTVGIIDFLTHINMFDYEENTVLRDELFSSYKKNCSS